MGLPEDFGRKYIEEGGPTFPKDKEDRVKIVETFILAQKILTELGYHPDEDISTLVAAYQGLSVSIREGLENGLVIGRLNPTDHKAVRSYFGQRSSFFGNADIFVINQVALESLNHDDADIVIDANTKVSWGMPPSMIMTYARSLASEN